MIEVAEHELLNVLYNEMAKYLTKDDSQLLEKLCTFAPSQCATDAFFFCCDTLENAQLIYDKLVQFDTEECPHVLDMIHLSIFKNHYYYLDESSNDGKFFVVKETLQSQEPMERFTICAVQLEDRTLSADHFEKALNRFSSSNE
ncbi:hypothetical protein NAEGRDRAFT_78552 [Naegleria gruberi]|uniref:Uncharacterized protein n=1 Tax=Naegleria gruberi TaxID=5762 RepID=D2V4J6_NAEGR|nr:uncharacterized protein NAEGRDRAFT_78552 [Naegleria gruberi]EFC48526.1 hypothetical protein NAEGRDRAFT_78552 [Naegleria gruberi]|eukprot:XP_002681270.1 hypothetical protein NAEGRDRAFT_78552 [Naegleria gruberi strain NEG-M]